MPKIGLIISPAATSTQKIESSAYLPEVKSYFTAVQDAGGTLSDTVKLEWNTAIATLKEASLYERFKFITPKLGGTAESAVLDATGNFTPLNVNFTNADADPICGLTGDGSTKKIDYLLTAAQTFSSPYSWTFGIQLLSTPGFNTYPLGCYGGSTAAQIFKGYGSSEAIYGNNMSTFASYGNGGTLPRIIIGTRRSETELKYFMNGTATAVNTTLNNYPLGGNSIREFGILPNFDASKHGVAFAIDAISDTEATLIINTFKTFYTNITA